MPIYEYQCGQCGHQMEVIQKMDEPALSECPKCQHAALEKKVSAAGFQLKGTGWYVTDFKGGSDKAAVSDVSSKETTQTDSSKKKQEQPPTPPSESKE